MSSSSRPDIPAYFAATKPAEWDIACFLDAQAAALGRNYDHNRAVGTWISSLRHLEHGGGSTVAAVANAKLAKYFTERPSDRIRARNWRDRRNRTLAKADRLAEAERKERARQKAKAERKSKAKNAQRVTNVYHAPINVNHGIAHGGVNQGPGDVHNSSTLAPNPSGEPSLSGGDRARRSRSPTPSTPPGTAIPATAPPALDRCSSTEQSEDEDAVRLRDVCSSLYQVYSRMTDKLSLGSPRTTRASEAADHLEDRVYRYASKLHRLDPVHFCILDRTSLSTIVVDEDVQAAVLDRVPGLPAFPHALEIALSRYDRVRTTDGCREIARESARDPDVYWIDDTLRHIVGLITETNSLLGLANLNEGVWETLVYAPIWDAYFSRLPDVLLQRKEIPLLAAESEPYAYLSYVARYDGVVQTRTGFYPPRPRIGPSSSSSLPSSSSGTRQDRLELCLFEISAKFEGLESFKWLKDRTKLLAGCRAMLYRLMEVVAYDAAVLKKLQVVGVLQAGRYNQLFIMSCLSRNLFYVRGGRVREFPTRLDNLEQAYDIVSTVWKARMVVKDTCDTLKSFFACKDAGKSKRTDEDFL